MASKDPYAKIGARKHRTAADQSAVTPSKAGEVLVPARWLLLALSGTVVAAVLCTWGVLCLLFWQGSWQLLYHPARSLASTPESSGLTFEPVGFATNEVGTPRLKGWWIPAVQGAAFSRFTVLYLHGQNGNLSDTIDALARLHTVGVNVLAMDYRGYGQSEFVRPSEAHWRQDVAWALDYLTATRHVDEGSIILDGESLGANLALEEAAARPELAGVVVHSPEAAPMNVVFEDARARLLPAALLVRDRYDLNAAATQLRIPVLWLEPGPRPGAAGPSGEPPAFRKISARKLLVWIDMSGDTYQQFADAFSRWLDDLPQH